jgi:hypothetical protein
LLRSQGGIHGARLLNEGINTNLLDRMVKHMLSNKSKKRIFLSLGKAAEKHGWIFLGDQGRNPSVSRQELFELSPLIGIERVKNRTNTKG